MSVVDGNDGGMMGRSNGGANATAVESSPHSDGSWLLDHARQAEVVRDLHRLAQTRAALAAHIETDRKEGLTHAEEEIQRARRDLPSSRDEQLGVEKQSYHDQRKVIFERFDREYGTLQVEFERLVAEANSAAEHTLRTELKKRDDARWNAEAVYEAVKNEPAKKFEEFKKQAEAWAERLRAEWQNVLVILAGWNLSDLAQTSATPQTEFVDQLTPSDRLQQFLSSLTTGREKFSTLKLPALAVGGLPIFGTVALTALLAVLVGAITKSPIALGVAVVISVTSGVIGRMWLQRRARAEAEFQFRPLAQTIADAEAFLPRCVADQKALCERKQAENLATRDNHIRDAGEHHDRTTAEAQRRRDALRDEYESTYPPQMQRLVVERDESVRKLDDAHRARVETIQRDHNGALANAETHYTRALEEIHVSYASQKQALEESWQSGVARLRDLTQQIREEASRVFPAWETMAADDWQAFSEVPTAMRIGALTVGLRPPVKPREESDTPSGIPEPPLEPTFALPALVPSPTDLSLLLEARGDGRRAAVRTLQAYMLRLVTALPPAKCRFTIIDPVGLGENFAAFMHLGDYDDQLISHRIWTEPRHIEQRLVDLSEHMENVIQKYLRNEFKTIDEYNRYAEEVAEPFRFLVVANFPTNFSEAAARRLMSIAASGPRCGVFVLLSIDSEQPLPAGFSLPDLRNNATSFIWRKDRFVGREGLTAEFPLVLDSPPPDETATRILHSIGRQAKNAGRVEVPFEAICPPSEEYWRSSARAGIDVPLGRSGATRLQAMKLGSGTSQHVLIAGKTGSGKSTLLHALITSIALRYSPDEIELYLVDFKQGVEFKTYAVHALPHARVVAIESDREFGLSVLEKLDAELRRRAELFRKVEVQDLAGYRDAASDTPLPRIMLIVDEFQEFFTEDDRTAHDSALLLDRLVRQGRAFGIHILLGSQTLAGAYSLARSTLGQMAVRIALQCSEADAHLILSEDNTAARLLSRAGEAIYNDSNGLIEGNHPFQVVWLPDERREHYLDRVLTLEAQNGYAKRPRLVFEGNVPADLEKNHLLAAWLGGAKPRDAKTTEWKAWLGDAVSIKDPTAAVFRPHSGSNLLLIGQNDEASMGMFVSSLVSLAVQLPKESPAPARTAASAATLVAEKRLADFTLFDGSPAGSPAAIALGRSSELLGKRLRRAAGREIPAVLDELAAEVARRQQLTESHSSPLFVFVYAIQALRDLRKDDDDFGFSRHGEDKPASPAKQFGTILREGPAVGVHVIVWCDTLNNLNRTFDRQMLREFEQRVLLQMSGNDSSTLIDTLAASKLGMNRALLADDAENRLEKFRPYRVPPKEWLAESLHFRSSETDSS